jgi:hypothetical protein
MLREWAGDDEYRLADRIEIERNNDSRVLCMYGDHAQGLQHAAAANGS